MNQLVRARTIVLAVGAALAVAGAAAGGTLYSTIDSEGIHPWNRFYPRLRWETESGHQMSALLFIPDTATVDNPAPAIVCSHGWYNNREMQDLNYVEYARRGFDGLIHVKSAGCTPEIDVMPVLQNISADYKIPVLYLTYDAQTSDVGLMTRLEAFYDMIDMRKKVL